MWKWLKRLLFALGLLVTLVLMGFIPVSLMPLRGAISDISYAAMGVELEIAGGLSVRLGLSPSLKGSGISVGLPGTKNIGVPAAIISVGRLHVVPKLIDIIRGDLYFAAIEITDVDVDYCAPLPVSEADAGDSTDIPALAVDYIAITDTRIFCSSAIERKSQQFNIAAVKAQLPAQGALLVSVEGKLAALPVKARIESDNLDDLLAELSDMPLHITADLATLNLDLDARLQLLATGPRLTGQLVFQSDDPQWLTALAGASLPQLGALTGSLQMSADSKSIELSELAFLVANVPVLDSAVSLTDGTLSVDIDDGAISLTEVQLQLAGNELQLDAQLDTAAVCPKLDLVASAIDIEIQPLGEVIQRQVTDAPDFGGVIGGIKLESESCGPDLAAHIKSLTTLAQVNDVALLMNGRHLPVAATSFALDAGWAKPVLFEFAGTVLREPAAISVEGGTLNSLLSGAAVPLAARLTAAGADIRFDGRIGAGSALDAYSSGLLELLNLTVTGEQPFLDGMLSVSVPRIGSLHGLTGIAAASQLSLSSSSKIIVTNRSLVTEKFSIGLGDSDLRGKVDFVFGDGDPTATITARSELLDVEQITSLLPTTDATPDLPADDGSTSRSFNLDRPFVGSDIILPSLNLDVLLEEITGSPLQIQQVSIGGQVEDQIVKEARLALLIEDTPFRGTVNTDLRSARKHFNAHFGAEDVDLDQILEALGLPGDQAIEVARTDTRFSASGNSIREFIQTSRLDIDIRSLRWADKQTAGESSFDVDLDHILISMTPEQRLIWQSEGYINKVRVNGWAATPSLYDWLGSEPIIPFKVVVGAKNYTVMLTGEADRGNADFLAANVVLSGAHAFTPLDQIPALESPLNGFELSADFQAFNNGDFASQLSARKGTSQFDGSARVGVKDDRQKIDVELNAARIQTADFVQIAQQWRDARQFQADGRLEGDAEDAAIATAESPELDEGNLMLIVDDFIDQLVEQRDIDVRLSIADLSAGESQLGNASLHLQLDEEQLRLDPLRISYADGAVNASYLVSSAGDSRDAQFDIEIDNLEIGGLLPLFNPAIDIAADMYLDAELTASSPAQQAFSDSINGEITLLLIPEEVDASILDLWATNLVLALLPTPDSGGDKTLNCMVARFEAEDGILTSKGILLDSTDIIVRGRGSIDIPNQQLDLLAAPQAKRERFFSVSTPVRVTGPWSDFQVGVEPGGFIGTMFRWYMALIYVPFKWLTGERFAADGLETCFSELDLEVPPELLR